MVKILSLPGQGGDFLNFHCLSLQISQKFNVESRKILTQEVEQSLTIWLRVTHIRPREARGRDDLQIGLSSR